MITAPRLRGEKNIPEIGYAPAVKKKTPTVCRLSQAATGRFIAAIVTKQGNRKAGKKLKIPPWGFLVIHRFL